MSDFDALRIETPRLILPQRTGPSTRLAGEMIHAIEPENLASQRVAEKFGSRNLGPGKLPPPFDGDRIDLWGQTLEQWLERRKRELR